MDRLSVANGGAHAGRQLGTNTVGWRWRGCFEVVARSGNRLSTLSDRLYSQDRADSGGNGLCLVRLSAVRPASELAGVSDWRSWCCRVDWPGDVAARLDAEFGSADGDRLVEVVGAAERLQSTGRDLLLAMASLRISGGTALWV